MTQVISAGKWVACVFVVIDTPGIGKLHPEGSVSGREATRLAHAQKRHGTNLVPAPIHVDVNSVEATSCCWCSALARLAH